MGASGSYREKLFSRHKNHQLTSLFERGVCIVTVVILVALFVWGFYVNFLFSQSYDFMILREIDDFFFHKTLHQMYTNLQNGEWIAFFSNTDYGYGNLYWVFMGLFTWPLKGWAPDWMGIVIPRQVSLLALASCFHAFYRIGRVRGFARSNILLSILLLSTCSGLAISSLRFHNYTLMTALLLWSLYFLFTPPTRRRLILASVLFGLAVGTKLSCILALPIFYILLRRDLKSFKRKFHATLWILGSFAFAFSPALVLWPFNLVDAAAIFSPIRHILTARFSDNYAQAQPVWSGIRQHVFGYYYHVLVFACGAAGAGVLIFKNWKRGFNTFVIPVVTLISVFGIYKLLSITANDAYFSRFYVLPYIFVFSFIFMDLVAEFKTKMAVAVLSLALMNAFFNVYTIKNAYLEYYLRMHSAETHAQVERYQTYKQKIQFEKDDQLFIEYWEYFPMGLIENSRNVDFFYPHEFQCPWEKKNVIVFKKQSDRVLKSCEQLQEQGMNADCCRSMKEVLALKAPYTEIFADDFIKVIRRR